MFSWRETEGISVMSTDTIFATTRVTHHLVILDLGEMNLVRHQPRLDGVQQPAQRRRVSGNASGDCGGWGEHTCTA